MATQKRERIGSFVLTTNANLDSDGIICAMCQKQLSVFYKDEDTHSPSCEQLLKEGAVPVPNFGWFCSQECGNAYQNEYGTRFQRDVNGNISYYS